MKRTTIPHGSVPPVGLQTQADKTALMRLNENIVSLQKQINALKQEIAGLKRKKV